MKRKQAVRYNRGKRILSLCDSIKSITPICETKMRLNIDKSLSMASPPRPEFRSMNNSTDDPKILVNKIFSDNSKIYSDSIVFKHIRNHTKMVEWVSPYDQVCLTSIMN